MRRRGIGGTVAAKDARARRAARLAKRVARDQRPTVSPSSVSVSVTNDLAEFAHVFGGGGDACQVPADLPHCHAHEVEHSDGVTECVLGDECEAPGELHTMTYSCSLVVVDDLVHRCDDCR